MPSPMDAFAAMVNPAAGYRPGMDAEHLYFTPMALAAQDAVAKTDPSDPAAAGAGGSPVVDRAVMDAFAGGGGFAGAVDPGTGVGGSAGMSGPSVKDTTGQFDLSEGGIGAVAGAALPMGSVVTNAAKIAQMIEGPYATVDRYPNARPGTPEWDANMRAQRQAHRMNENRARGGRANERVAAGEQSRHRDTSPGRRGARESSRSMGPEPSDMESERGRQSGAGGNSERVICTELYRQGKLAREDWKRDLAFTSKYLSRRHVDGYHWWACGVVRALRQGRWVRFWSFWANHRAAEIAYQMGDRPRGDWLGKAFRWTVEPACWVIGAFVGKSDWEALYREPTSIS